MSERSRISLYQLKQTDKGIVDQFGRPFDAQKYSRFKYGDGEIAEEYGCELADLIAERQKELFENGSKLVVTAVPFRTIPIGANAIADGVYKRVNYQLDIQQTGKASRIKIAKHSAIHEGDYGALPEEERAKIMADQKLAVEEPVAGKNLLVVDDIVITGQSAETVASYVDTLGTLSVHYLYVAQLHEEQGKKNPLVERRLNESYVKDLDTLANVIATRNFILNLRVAKFILSYENSKELQQFFRQADTDFLHSLQNGIVIDNLHTRKSYRNAAAYLSKELGRRQS